MAEGPWAGITIGGLRPGVHEVTLWRSAAGERVAVRGARGRVVVDSDFLVDYEAPLGRPVTYELQVRSGPDAGARVDTAEVVVPSASGIIHDPLEPTNFVPVWAGRAPTGQPVFASGAFAALARTADVEVMQVIGSAKPVAIGGQRRQPAEVNLSVLVEAEAQNNTLRELVDGSAVLVIRGLPGWLGEAWPAVAFVAVPEVVEEPLAAHLGTGFGSHMTRWEMTGQVVRESAASVLVALFTYDDVEALFRTYDTKQAAAAGRTYLQDLKDPANTGRSGARAAN